MTSENVEYSTLFVYRFLQDEKGLYTSPTLLAGDIDTGRAMLLTGNMEPVAEKKFQVCVLCIGMNPCYVLVIR